MVPNKEILEELLKYNSFRTIADKLNVTVSTVQDYIKKYYINIKELRIGIDQSKFISKEKNTINLTKEEIEFLYIENKKTTTEIAKIYNISYSVLSRLFKKYQIEIRSGTEVFTASSKERVKKRKVIYTNEVRENMREAQLGKKHSPETVRKRTESIRKLYNSFKTTESLEWLKLYDKIRKSTLHFRWKSAIKSRDSFVCIIYGDKENIEVDHIIPLLYLIKSNKITTRLQAENCIELWKLENGRVLCRKCHSKTDTYGEKAKQYTERELQKMKPETTINDLFIQLGYDYKEMEVNESIDVSSEKFEIFSYDAKIKENVWANITKIVRKEPANAYVVYNKSTKLPMFKGTAEHKIFIRTLEIENAFYTSLSSLIGDFKFSMLHNELGWIEGYVFKTEEIMEVLDLEVEGTHCYYSGGILSHNTLYGDPITTSGGLSIPYSASVRLRMMTPKPIKNSKDDIIGVTVEVKTIKNKVANPFRSCELNIMFGKGVDDTDQMFDVLKAHCSVKGPLKALGKRIMMEGGGAWKTFSISDDSTGEVLHEVKFYKVDFKEKVLNIPEYKEYIELLLEAAMVMNPNDTSHQTLQGVDSSSIEELKAQEDQE